MRYLVTSEHLVTTSISKKRLKLLTEHTKGRGKPGLDWTPTERLIPLDLQSVRLSHSVVFVYVDRTTPTTVYVSWGDLHMSESLRPGLTRRVDGGTGCQHGTDGVRLSPRSVRTDNTSRVLLSLFFGSVVKRLL